MTEQDEKQLRIEIEHIFDSGANELRVFNMVKAFVEKRYQSLRIHDDAGQSKQLLDFVNNLDETKFLDIQMGYKEKVVYEYLSNVKIHQ